MSQPRPNIFFPSVIIAGFVFVVTILALIAGVMGDGDAPMHKWLNRHGTTLIVCEVAVIGVTGFLALVIDRWQTLRAKPTDPVETPPAASSKSE